MQGYVQSHQTRTTCLIMYSRADVETILRTERFANVVKDAFNHGTKFSRVLQWACSKEKHSNGELISTLTSNVKVSMGGDKTKNKLQALWHCGEIQKFYFWLL